MSGEPPTKPKGRARGRPRAETEQTRRPGQETRPAPVPQPAAVHPAPNGGGRRTHRGAPRSDTIPPQTSVDTMTAAMAVASVSDSSGRGRRVEADSSGRGRRFDFGNDNTRPEGITDKRGTSGESITLVANFYKLITATTWRVYQYHVDFSPVVESTRMRQIFMRDHKEQLGDAFLFDGMSDLKTIKKLDKEVTEFFSTRHTDNETIRITVKRVAELAPEHPELARLYNTQMRRNLKHLKYQLLGRYFFDPEAVSTIDEYNLQVWQGVITSIRQQEEDILMSVDTVHKIVRQQTAFEVFRNIARNQDPNYKDAVARELVGTIVMTRYNNKTYRVEDIIWDLTPADEYDFKSGRITFLEYYRKQYDITIRDPKQPLMLCTSKEREIRQGESKQKQIYLIPELCSMTGLTESMRSDFTMMKEIAKKTRLDPSQRVRNLQTFIERLNRNETVVKEMGMWGMEFAKNLVRFQARINPPETIRQGNALIKYEQRSGDFSKEMRGKPMHVAKCLDDWIVICTRYDEQKCNDFLTNLYRVCRPMGMEVQTPQVIVIPADRVNNYIQAFREKFRPTTKMVTFIVPNNKKERYDALKKHTCLDNAVPSQVIVAKTLNKKPMLMSVATKIGIQLNCKLGGEPWAIDIPFKMKLMIVGYDTYHDSSRKGRSAGALVASLNQSCTRWYSKVSFHSAGGWEELSNYICINLTEALKRYQEMNKCSPDRIIFYRDGVGDGQIRYVKEHEIKQFKDTIKALVGDKDTRQAFVVVNKKINARFFAPVSSNSYGNPPPGTVIDHTVTRQDRYDFFLISQSVRQGTVGPTMYNVIDDNTNLKPEHLQRLSYKLTHLYYNWPGTIRVPAPCQYAHKLAFLAGQSLHQSPREELSNTLFYL